MDSLHEKWNAVQTVTSVTQSKLFSRLRTKSPATVEPMCFSRGAAGLDAVAVVELNPGFTSWFLIMDIGQVSAEGVRDTLTHWSTRRSSLKLQGYG